MTRRFLTCLVGFAVLTAILVGNFVFAQSGPMPGHGPMRHNMMPPAPPQVHLIKASDEGVFVLVGPSLFKYDGATLKQEGVLQLIKKADQPAPLGDMGGMPKMPPPPIPAAMLITKTTNGTLALVVTGDEFISVDAATLKVKARTPLPKIEAPADGQPLPPPPPGMNPGGNEGGPGPGMPAPGPMEPRPALPVLELQDNTLYIQRVNQIAAVNINDGKLIAQTELPVLKPPAGN